MKRYGFVLALLGAGLAGWWTSLVLHKPRVFHAPTQFVAEVKNDIHAGEKVYREYCVSCHAPRPMIPVNAPRVGFPKDWERYHHMNLLNLALQGGGAMPARGGCFECDDDLIRQAIDYMLKR